MGCIGFLVGSGLEFAESYRAFSEGQRVLGASHAVLSVAKLVAGVSEGIICASVVYKTLPPSLVAGASVLVLPLCGAIAVTEGLRECMVAPALEDKILGIIRGVGGVSLILASLIPVAATAFVIAGVGLLVGVLFYRFARWCLRSYRSWRAPAATATAVVSPTASKKLHVE